MTAMDFFALGGLIFAARVCSKKQAVFWMLVFSFIQTAILFSNLTKGGAA